MTRRAIVWIMAVLATVSIAADCQAHWWHQMGRSAGLGWSDGYHSRTGCPRQGMACNVEWANAAPAVPSFPCAKCEPTPAQRPTVLANTFGPAMAQPQPAPQQPTEAAQRIVPTGHRSPALTTPSWSVPTPVRR